MTDNLTDDQREALKNEIELERAKRDSRSSFLGFLHYWSFKSRETGEVVTFEELWPGQEAFAQLMERERLILALKAGKLGFTELECAYDAWVALFGPPNARVHLFSRDDGAAQELLSYVRFGLSHLPPGMRPEPLSREAGGQTTHSLKFSPGEDDLRTIVAYPAGPNVSVEQSCQHAHIDELAKMPFPEKTWAAAFSTLAPGASCHIVTRGAGDDNYVATLWQAAVEGASDLYPFFQPWTARPDRDQAWFESQGGSLVLQALKHFAPETAEDALAGDADNEFIPIELWDRCREELPPFEPGTKEPVIVGVDAAVRADCFAIVAVTRHPERHDEVAVRAVRKWDPPRGGAIDFAEPESFLRAICKGGCAQGHFDHWDGCVACADGTRIQPYNVIQIAYDPYQLESMMGGFRKEDFVWCREFGQTTERLMADSQFRSLIVNRRIVHNGNRLLREHIQNAAADISPKEDTKLRIRKKRPDKKVDLAVALSMASSECLRLNL